ncbi:T-cell immunoglobulin and mucin domain-containing protein 4-like isoform X1 [Oncorhynchus tshawytscha]|uniref:T-cell immunoglobulin and mucin domain-containing protein 4-like isoform X1 n=1 Tax=Oncorhynchus tshawytscha TaxID=74940 RepID=UPI001C3DD7E7|nr:T-cell immunoglobulin and mucin domain-containing protein 4-like isoform X1 [Oncorhynchus tshawytscha]
MKILHVVSCFLLSAVVCVLSGVITMRWKEGGSGHINCPYDRGYEKNPKYLSKGTYRDRVVVIQTQTHRHPAWTHQGRYSLFDDTKRRVFTVTITNPVPEDSGTYWCGVDTWGPDQPAEVRLTVDRAPVPPNPGSITSRPLLSTSHPSTNITMTTDSSNSATDRTNGTVGTTASPPTDMARTQCNNSITLTDMTRTQGNNSITTTDMTRTQGNNSITTTDMTRTQGNNSITTTDMTRTQGNNSITTTDMTRTQGNNNITTDMARTQGNNSITITDMTRTQGNNSIITTDMTRTQGNNSITTTDMTRTQGNIMNPPQLALRNRPRTGSLLSTGIQPFLTASYQNPPISRLVQM